MNPLTLFPGRMPFLLAQEAEAAPTKTLLEYIRSGGFIGYVIILLSFVAVGLIIAHLIRNRPSRLAPPVVVDDLQRLLRTNDVEGAIAYCEHPDHDSFLTRVFGSALVRCSKSPFGLLEFRSALEEAGQEQVARLYRSTDGIGLIASVAPMLGLLGTVVGMVGAFDTIAGTKGAAAPDQLAGYISLALITTVQGLVVAIPCTAVFSYFRNRIDHHANDIAKIAEELASLMEAGPDSAKPPARRPASPRPVGASEGAAAR